MGFPPLLNLSTRLSTTALPGQTTKTALTEEFMFQNVAYRPTVYRTGDGIFEIKMIKKICLGVFRFEIGQFLVKLGSAHSLTRLRVSQKLTFVIVDNFEP